MTPDKKSESRITLRASVVVGVAAVAGILAVAPVQPQVNVCGNPAVCATGTMKTCSSVWGPNPYVIMVSGVVTTGAATGCSPGVLTMNNTLTFVAMRPTMAAAAGGCMWTGMFNFGGGSNNFFCTICGPETNTTNSATCEANLPVELMEFSVEETADEESRESPAS